MNNARTMIDSQAVRQELDAFIADWHDDASWMSGWRHHYFCDDDGSYLIYDPTQPHAHTCPECGRVYTDDKKNFAWVTIMRNKTLQMLKLAVIMNRQQAEARYASFIRQVILFYADHYREFPIHIKAKRLPDMHDYDRVQADLAAHKVAFDPHTTDWTFGDYAINFQGPGKIMAQGLSEAIALIRISLCYQMALPLFSDEEQARIKHELFGPACQFLEKQQFIEHNITLWREVCIQILKLMTGTYASQDLDRPLGIHEHLTHGLLPSGFWYEGSIHYHHYVLEALGYLGFFLHRYGQSDQQLETACAEMAQFSVKIAFDNGTFPNPNDGWPNVNLKTYLNVFELLAVSYPDNAAIQQAYAEVLSQQAARVALPIEDERFWGDTSATGLLLGQVPVAKPQLRPVQSANYPDAHLLMLKNATFNVFLKYGVYSRSHAHYDPFNTELTVNGQCLAKDLSNVGYGSELVRRWYNTPLGHNTVIIDESDNEIMYHSQIESLGADDYRVISDDQYSGVTIAKAVKLTAQTVQITSSAEASVRHTIDVVQHFDVPIMVTAGAATLTPLSEVPFYQQQLDPTVVHEAYRVTDWQQLTLHDPRSGATISFTSDLPAAFYLLETVGNPNTDNRFTVLARFNGLSAALTMNVTVSGVMANGRLND